jgi:hypothetical protein
VNEHVVVTSVRPQPSDDELVAITSALPMLWPARQPSRRVDGDRAWRFSGRLSCHNLA